MGAPLLAIFALLGLCIYAIISVDGRFKFVLIRKEDVVLRKRDAPSASSITFSLPWKSALEEEPKAKALSPVLAGLLGDVSNIASAILDSGSNEANAVASQAKALDTKAAAAALPTQASMISVNAAGMVASILSEVNSIVSDATGMIGGVVGDATSVVGQIVGGATSGLSTPATGSGQSSSGPSLSMSSSEPQEFLPQSHITPAVPGALSALNMTSSATLPMTSSSTAAQAGAGASCSAMATTTITPCCPNPSTVTCTVTETWHSTHYESTQTLYSFMSIFATTCTETVRVCQPSNPYLFLQNATSPSNPSLIACANGALAKRAEDCPAVTPMAQPLDASKPCPMISASSTPYPGGSAIPSVASLLSSAGDGKISTWSAAVLGSSSLVSSSIATMASFTANLPRITSLNTPPVSSIASLFASITCADGSLVLGTQACPGGLVGSATSSLLAFRTSALPIATVTSLAAAEVFNIAASANNKISSVIANVVSVLSNVPGLSGGLLSTVMAEVSSVAGALNTGGLIPTSGVLAAAGGATAVVGNGGVVAVISGATTALWNTLPTDGAVAVAGQNGASAVVVGVSAVAGNVAGVPSLVAAAGLGGASAAVGGLTAVAGNAGNAPAGNAQAENSAASILASLEGGLVRRRKLVNRGELTAEEDEFCEENEGSEICFMYSDGGGLKRDEQL